jgi:hypothetical protein
MILCLAFLVSQGHSSGYTSCSLTASVTPFPGSVDLSFQDSISVSCDHLDCTLSAGSNNDGFRGFVLSVEENSELADYDSAIAKAGFYANNCITHRNKNKKQTLSFSLKARPATLHLTVVSRKPQGASHSYGTKTVKLPRESGHAYIIGAGPGGLAAARYLASINHTNFTVYERGDFMPDSFWTSPIAATYYKSMNYTYNALGSSSGEYDLGIGVGGTQNINGAVFVPGTPPDLARSTGVSVSAAKSAQDTASSFVPHENGMMWTCLDPFECDYKTLAYGNTKMARRSIAYDLPDLVTDNIKPSHIVDSVTNNNGQVRIKFSGTDKPDVVLKPDDAVILSAGALASPTLVDKNNEFTGHNHYFDVSYEHSDYPYSAQYFEYDGTVETNAGALPAGSSPKWLQIKMEMEPAVRETHQYGKNYTSVNSMTQAWHFAGTMPHKNFLVSSDTSGQIYTGDAGALLKPFTCHTSMPAAAAGIMAAKSWLGVLEEDNAPLPVKSRSSVPIWLFVASIFIAFVGVVCHRLERIRFLHYILMPTSIVLVWVAIILIQGDDNSGAFCKTSTHYGLGYSVATIMTIQGTLGFLLLYRYKKPKKKQEGAEEKDKDTLKTRRVGRLHRLIGYGLLLIIIAQVWTSKDALTLYFSKAMAYTVYKSVGGVYTALVTVLMILIGYAGWKGAKGSLAAGFTGESSEKLLL